MCAFFFDLSLPISLGIDLVLAQCDHTIKVHLYWSDFLAKVNMIIVANVVNGS